MQNIFLAKKKYTEYIFTFCDQLATWGRKKNASWPNDSAKVELRNQESG